MKNQCRTLVRIFSFTGLLMLAVSQVVLAGQATMGNQPHAMLKGKVLDVVNVPNYTYAQVDTGKEKVWAAGPVTPLKVGDTIAFSTGMPIKDYKSKSIDRTFELVYFVTSFNTGGTKAATNTDPHAAMDISAPHSQLKQNSATGPIEGVAKAKDGKTIAEIHANKNDLNGKTIRVRGKVTKYNTKIMGKNWLHIQDSSSSDDLTVTTNATTKVGDVVVIEGKLLLNKDYGYGYIYPVIVEDATISK